MILFLPRNTDKYSQSPFINFYSKTAIFEALSKYNAC